MSNDVIVGIDLGTGTSCLSIFENGEAKVIVSEEGTRTIPSVVSYTKDEVVVGAQAKRQAIVNPTSTIYSAKRLIGKKYDELTEQEKRFPYKVKAGKNGKAVIEIDGKDITPEEVGAKVLQKLKKAAENYLGRPVNKAIITCPAYFSSSERESTKIAGEIAGFSVERVIAEPTAAALAFGLTKDKKSGTYAIYDFGSGTMDLSILDIDGDVVEVLSTSGDVFLGGDDLDQEVINWIVSSFKSTSGVDLSKDKMALQRLKEAAERAKIELSSLQETTINLPFITADSNGAKHLDLKLTRPQFERMIETYVDRTIECCRKALKDANKTVDEITEVLLVGGSTRVPLVQQRVKDFFKKEPNRSLNPDEAVSTGAAIQGGIIGGSVKDILLLDVVPLTLSIETLGGVSTPLVERNTTIPTRKSQVFSTAVDNQTSVEVVVLQGERKFAKDNKLLGRFHLDGIPASRRGTPQIDVSFDVDANGILSVSAKDKGTGKEQKITITASSGLSKDEIDRMKAEAEKYEEEDKKRMEEVNTKNSADAFVFNLEQTLEENETKLADNTKTEVRTKLNALKEELKTDNYDSIKALHEELMKTSYKMSEELYKTQEPSTPEPAPHSSTPNDNVIEAEVV